MTSISIKASRTRAGMLAVALALVGGTGCITTAIVRNVQQQNRMREAEAARQDRIAKLAPAAEAGDPEAQTNLARALMAIPAPGQVDQQRVFSRLSSAAEQGYGPAQALLGDMLLRGQIDTADFRSVPLAPVYQNRERGLRLLMQAATQACAFQVSEYQRYRAIHPAWLLGNALMKDGRPEEAVLWRARTALYCTAADPESLARQSMAQHVTPSQRMEALTLLQLTNDSAQIARAEAAFSADEVAAARRAAAALQVRLAQSLQQYPAPPRKDKP